MSSPLASRRLRTPAEAFALSQRPLPAGLRPHVRREEPRVRSRYGPADARASRLAGRGGPVMAGIAQTAQAARSGRFASPTQPSASPTTAFATASVSIPQPRARTHSSMRSSDRAATASTPATQGAGRDAVRAHATVGATASASAARGTGRAHTTVGATALKEHAPSESIAPDGDRHRVPVQATTLRAVPAARATVKRPTRPVRSALWKRRIRTFLAGLLLFGVVAIAFAAIAMHSQLASRQLRLNVLRSDVDSAEREHQRLRLTVAELDTPEQVVSSAYGLGLVGATEVEFLPTASTMQPVQRSAGPTVPDPSGAR